MGVATYTLHQCLGRGGFGEVYLATQASGRLEKRVAVKVLRKAAKRDDQALLRLRDEARMLAVLDHPAILGVHELTRLAGRVALVTEYVEGVDLSRCTSPKRLLPPRAVMGIMGEVAGALDCAWTTPSPLTGQPLQLVHRDVKPQNIRLSKHGEVKLLDFGVARTTQLDREARTVTGDMPFTPGYAPPEAFLEDGTIGAHTDIFALGVTTFRLLTGARFYGEHKLTGQVQLAHEPASYAAHLQAAMAQLPEAEGVRALLTRVLSYDPAERPSAAELEARCAALVDGMEGPTVRRWARAVAFPDAKALDGADLVGQVLEEELEGIRIDPPTLPTGLGQRTVRPDTATVIRDLPPGSGELPLPAPPPPRPRWRLGLALVVLGLCLVGVAALTVAFMALLSALAAVWLA